MLGVAGWWCSWWRLPTARGSKKGSNQTCTAEQNGKKERRRCLGKFVSVVFFYLVGNETKILG